ncbi:SNF1-related protein kinase regulatory subunit gamma-like PV42a [Impatiens glandulifera]|uniref:SNF1-related protein kinase regulatory subunit gamma-like PV42a n=1 Tax=Impatiens glandulifera TaxID=253017 RepID=UPI001FB06CEC|nr:SNF1-related protein kinase regulatory subunit gamma-like PV42a [Impatiens glandulifera]
MNAFVANRVVAVPVAAPPGHWIGAGGSMILEEDKQTGSVRKHYIGMITMLDILAHIAGDYNSGSILDESTLEQRMSVPVSSIIGHCLESLSLWTLNANTSVLECMEVFSKGIHRALVPIDGKADNPTGVELMDSASGYRMLTQMDLLRFIKAHDNDLKSILSHSVSEAGAINDVVFGVTAKTKVIDAIKCMRSASLNAVPILEVSETMDDNHTQLINGKGRKLVGTFSSTDLRECPIAQMHSWLSASVLDFTEILGSISNSKGGESDMGSAPWELVTCCAGTTLSEVIDKVVSSHVHRIWVVKDDDKGCLDGLVSLTDLIKVIRAAVIAESR